MDQPNKYSVIISTQASDMLVKHAAFLALSSPEAAERLTVSFERAAYSLELFPQRCPLIEGLDLPEKLYRALLFEKRYLLVFQIKAACVYVEQVLDTRQDYRWLLS